jgi:molybdenum cofactor cytidylyltransferase
MIRSGLLLAAGASRRFGAADKLLSDYAGAPLVLHAARAMVGLMLDRRFAVVSSETVARALTPLGFELVRIAPGQMQSVSLAAGITAVQASDAGQALLMLGDMPALETESLMRILTLAGRKSACASDGVTPMPPAVFPRENFDALRAMTGDKGARALIARIPSDRHLVLPARQLVDSDRA